jgi:hypothetical protein
MVVVFPAFAGRNYRPAAGNGQTQPADQKHSAC